MTRRRRGYVLLVVLWSVVVMATAATGVALLARQAIATASNRVAAERARWLAEGCAGVVIAGLQASLTTEQSDRTWEALDSVPVTTPGACLVTLRPVGIALHVNGASEPSLTRFLAAAGMPPEHADSLSAAISDWRDVDSDQRNAGAEASWYRGAGRIEPRDAPFASSAEVLLVRGAEWLPGVDTLLTTEPDAILLTRAPVAVLAGIPNLDDAAIAAILVARRERPFPSLATIAGRLEEPSRTMLLSAFHLLVGATTTTATAWLLEARARALDSSVEVTVQVRLARDGQRLAIVSRRSWP